MELLSQMILFATATTFIATANGQCPSRCFCLAGYVTCSRLTSFPRSFPEDTIAIIISNMVVDEIPSGIFNKLPALETIELYLGTVGKIATGAFKSLTYLDSISLSELRIGVIEPYAFHNITDIGTISIYMSEIETIESYAFCDIFALDEIKLFMLNVTKIESLALCNIDEIFQFRFYTNNIRSLQPYAFTNFTNVNELSLYLNHFGYMGCGSIESLLTQSYEHSFYSNSVNCSCDLAWIRDDPVIENHLFSNWCQVPNTDEKIYWEDISSVILECSIEEISECSPTFLFEFTKATDASKRASNTRTTVTIAPQPSSVSTEETKRVVNDTQSTPLVWSFIYSETTASSSPSLPSDSFLSSETTVSSPPALASETLSIPYVSSLPSSPSDATQSTKAITVSMSESIISRETTGLPRPMLSNAPTIQNASHTSTVRTSTLKSESSASKLPSRTNVNNKLEDVISRSTKSSSYNFHDKVEISNETVDIHAVTVRETDSSTERKNPQKILFRKEDTYVNSAAYMNGCRIGVTFALCFCVIILCTSVNVNL